MPFLRVETNVSVTPEQHRHALTSLSREVAEALEKSEEYFMVTLMTEQPLIFAGNDQAAAMVSLQSLGLDSSQTTKLTGLICSLLEQHLAVPPARIYIVFTSIDRPMWGWNKKTFG